MAEPFQGPRSIVVCRLEEPIRLFILRIPTHEDAGHILQDVDCRLIVVAEVANESTFDVKFKWTCPISALSDLSNPVFHIAYAARLLRNKTTAI